MDDRDPAHNGEEHGDNPEDVAAKHPTKNEDQDEEQRDDAAEEAAADTFPASDAPAW
jgi:hypothetical protein